MELFERVRYLCEIKDVSQAKLGKSLGLSQSAFNRWLKKDTEHNIWNHLPKILELFPDVRPEWLYMGQEPVFKDGAQERAAPTPDEMAELQAENARLRAELAEADRVNRQLTTRLFMEGGSTEESAGSTGNAAGQG